MPPRKLHFNILLGTHAKTGKTYAMDASVSCGKDITEWTDGAWDESRISTTVQDFDFDLTGIDKLNGYYKLYVGDDFVKLCKKNEDGSEYEIHQANYEWNFDTITKWSHEDYWKAMGNESDSDSDSE